MTGIWRLFWKPMRGMDYRWIRPNASSQKQKQVFLVSNSRIRHDFPIQRGTAPCEISSCPRTLNHYRDSSVWCFFSNFIPNYSDLITPVYAKLKKFQPWTDEEIFCFESLKTSVFDSALYIPNQHETFLYTDASDIAISGVLVNAAGRPIQFCSRKLTDAESHYDIVEREALAVYWSINRCRTFLLGRQFVVFSDHKGLQCFFRNLNATPNVIR